MKTKLLFAMLLMLALAAHAAPAGWKPVFSADKTCAAMVPGNWGPAVTGMGAQIPHGRSYVRVSTTDDSLADAKAAIAAFYNIKATFEDSSARYWVETGGGAADTMRHWTVEVPAKHGLCKADIGFDTMLSETDAKTIALSLKPH